MLTAQSCIYKPDMAFGGLSFFILLAAYISLGTSLHCYQCNSKQEPDCLEPRAANLSTVDCQDASKTLAALERVADVMTRLGQAPARDATDLLGAARPSSATLSTNSCQKIILNVEGERVVGRGCSVALEGMSPCDSLKLSTSSDVSIVFCSVCHQDGCNGSIPCSLSTLLLMVCTSLLMAAGFV